MKRREKRGKRKIEREKARKRERLLKKEKASGAEI